MILKHRTIKQSTAETWIQFKVNNFKDINKNDNTFTELVAICLYLAPRVSYTVPLVTPSPRVPLSAASCARVAPRLATARLMYIIGHLGRFSRLADLPQKPLGLTEL